MNGDEFGDAGKRVLLEEAIDGKELSYIILTDGTNFIPLAPTRDHKRAFDNDEGPNTGGMGTYSTDGMLARELEDKFWRKLSGRRWLDCAKKEWSIADLFFLG